MLSWASAAVVDKQRIDKAMSVRRMVRPPGGSLGVRPAPAIRVQFWYRRTANRKPHVGGTMTTRRDILLGALAAGAPTRPGAPVATPPPPPTQGAFPLPP